MVTQTEHKFSVCGHVDVLMTLNTIHKKEGRFLDSGMLMNIETGKNRRAPVLRFLTEGPSGKQSVGRDWIEVQFCPTCGAKVDALNLNEATL